MEQIKERKEKAKQEEHRDWLAYLKKVGSTPLSPGSKELTAAILWTEGLILDCCIEQDCISISFQEGIGNELPFFPTDAKLGDTLFADRFREEAAANLSRALREKNPGLQVPERYQSVDVAW